MRTEFVDIQLTAIVAALPDPAFVVGEQGAVIAANQNAVIYFNQDMIGKHITTFVRAPAMLQAINDAILQTKISQVSHVVRTPVQRSYDIHVSPLGVDENHERMALLILRDQTHEQQVERMRSDFVANASHELRTPLASLSGFIETMQGAAKNDAKAKDEFLILMKAQADRMASLIDDLLSLSKIEIDEHVAPTEIADLAIIVKRDVELLARAAAESKCELQINVPQSLKVRGDNNQLSQVVHNLIENAIKYGGSGKAIEIEGSIKNGLAILAVRDHGPGIAAHHVPRLTERFYRVSAQDSRNRGGTGLGLAIVKHILNRHRGKLQIESELGIGSIFTIQLPVEK